jgi:hypothetical protein
MSEAIFTAGKQLPHRPRLGKTTYSCLRVGPADADIAGAHLHIDRFL